ncbi:hypothetical protein Agub_g12348 [Astrephomene gubernaculifera]|uniref:protein-tyrosine-phosphatase n=1 Tax=Astrephomene gubernaculifera TaxID=47775 RepID=A0AAD3DYH9_9CHLO|nr:hypothetical protein Agub_g12348 [Astrephomene gubernaculifera]
MGGCEDEFAQAVEIISGLYYFLPLKRPDSPRYSPIAQSNICYCIDDELLYEPFFADFGPLNLGRTYRFCQKTKQLLQEAEKHGKRLYLYAGPHAHQKANAAVLVGIYQVIYLNRTADVAYKPLSAYKPYVPFRDASCGVSTFHLTVYDVIRGLQRAHDVGFIDWNSGSSTWSLDEYEFYEQVENGDLNWIVPGKFVAFSGPAARSNEVAGYRLHTPEDYWDYFRRRGVTTVVRLNKKVYDRKRFLDGGFKHHEMYFPDGSCPSEAIIQRFLETVEAEPGAIAVHCKAGLGRTGLLICLYIMKHYRFTAEEVLGYIRVCRPGSVIGPQQNFIREMEARMWHEGEMYRAARGMPKVAPAVSDLVVAGRAAGHAELAASPSPLSIIDGAAAAAVAAAAAAASNVRTASYGSIGSGSVAGAAAVAQPSYGLYRSNSGTANGGRSGSAGSTHGPANGTGSGSIPFAGAVSASAVSPGDASLLQYSKLQQYGGGSVSASYGTIGTSSNGYLTSDYNSVSSPAVLGGGVGSSVASPGVNVGGYTSSYSAVSSVSSFRNRYSATPSGYNSGVGRSMTPLRYGTQNTGAYHMGVGMGAHHHHAGTGGHYGGHHHGVSASHPGPLQASGAAARGGPIGISSVSRSMQMAPSSAAAAAAAAAAGMGRSPSTGRLSAAAGLAAPPTASVAGLRSTLHTDTLAAADRPKLIPERNTQSADIGSGFGLGNTSLAASVSGGVMGAGQAGGGSAPWRIAAAGQANGASSTTAGGAPGGMGVGATRASSIGGRSGSTGSHTGAPAPPGAGNGGVVRVLAPNGQPRKVPVALLHQYSQQQYQQQQAGVGSIGGWAAAGGGGGGVGSGSVVAALAGAGISGTKPPSASSAAQLRSGYSYGMRQ